jgi:hypothetical protein
MLKIIERYERLTNEWASLSLAIDFCIDFNNPMVFMDRVYYNHQEVRNRIEEIHMELQLYFIDSSRVN